MLVYGKQDIVVLRNLHKRIMGWDKSGVGLITKEINGVNTKDNHELLCSHCGSKDVDKLTKRYTTTSAVDDVWKERGTNEIIFKQIIFN